VQEWALTQWSRGAAQAGQRPLIQKPVREPDASLRLAVLTMAYHTRKASQLGML